MPKQKRFKPKVEVIKPPEELLKPKEEEKPYVTPVVVKIAMIPYMVNLNHRGKELKSDDPRAFLSLLRGSKNFRRIDIDIDEVKDKIRMMGEKDTLAYLNANSEAVEQNPLSKAERSQSNAVVSLVHKFNEETKPLEVLKTAPKKT